MATPLNQEAEEARGYFARERRRKKQDQKDFDIAGFEAPPFEVRLLAVNVGGAGYAVGDQFSVTGGTFVNQCIGYVVAETAGLVNTVAILEPGDYTISPGPAAATSALTGVGVGLTVDPTLSGLFDFGAVALSGQSANALTLPAAGFFALLHTSATDPADMGIVDLTTAVTYPSADPGQAGGRVNIRRQFPSVHEIAITRGPAGPAGSVQVFFRGPKSQLVQIGEATFT